MAVDAKRKRLSGLKSISNIFLSLKEVRVLCCDVSMIPVLKLNDTDFEKCDWI
jgi:hypothetical protein